MRTDRIKETMKEEIIEEFLLALSNGSGVQKLGTDSFC